MPARKESSQRTSVTCYIIAPVRMFQEHLQRLDSLLQAPPSSTGGTPAPERSFSQAIQAGHHWRPLCLPLNAFVARLSESAAFTGPRRCRALPSQPGSRCTRYMVLLQKHNQGSR
jgi:hypothetical protein